MTAMNQVISGVRTVASDIAEGFFEITHNSFALLGLSVVLAVAILGARPDLRASGEDHLRGWLQERRVALLGMPIQLDAVERATAANPKELPKAQAAVTYWLSRKYSVAPEPIGALVAEAFTLGAKNKLDPTMILAIMAVESSFNPFAQSHVGAQGLMQVMTTVHSDKYENFGGHFAAFDPVSNLRVGVRVLQECIARAGSLEGGLRYYVGAANIEDGGYVSKVMAEHNRLLQVAAGRQVPTFTPPLPAAPRPAAPIEAVAPVLDNAAPKAAAVQAAPVPPAQKVASIADLEIAPAQ